MQTLYIKGLNMTVWLRSALHSATMFIFLKLRSSDLVAQSIPVNNSKWGYKMDISKFYICMCQLSLVKNDTFNPTLLGPI